MHSLITYVIAVVAVMAVLNMLMRLFYPARAYDVLILCFGYLLGMFAMWLKITFFLK